MREKMNISVNGQSRVPPGFRFHPTEEELLQYYLRKKVANHKIDLDVIFEVDLNKLEPWDIQDRCKIGSTPQNDWYFFSHKDKKYPTGTRTNRATTAGFWKATGRDKVIHGNGKRIGMRKTLVFYKGRAPHGLKSDWIMHEYRLYHHSDDLYVAMNEEVVQEEGWVVCRIFKKKNLHKTLNIPINNTPTVTMEVDHQSSMFDSSSDRDQDHHDDQGALEQIFQSMGSNSKNKNNNNNNNQRFMKLPSLDESSNQVQVPNTTYQQPNDVVVSNSVFNSDSEAVGMGLGPDWTGLDRFEFVATYFNGQPTDMMALASIFSSSSSSSRDDLINQIELPPLRSSPPSTSSGIIEIYHPAATLDDL